MHYEELFQKIYKDLQQVNDSGSVANYIPELARVDPDQFGVHLSTITGENYLFGDAEKRFSIQSIAKVFSFVLAYSDRKSTRLNSSHVRTSYAVFCLKNKICNFGSR